MKFFKKRATLSFLLSLSMSATSISTVFAEGSREVNTVPKNVTTEMTDKNPAYRAYFDWRDRNEFGMPSENVIYAYANEGETIYFGSNVTSANDRSIQAVVEPKIGFTTTLDSTGEPWAGSSIAVTLPSTDNPTKAFDPTSMDVKNFADGSTLETEKSQSKVYLFKPTVNGAGHIANISQEKNGPRGVDGMGNEGYEPLSFVAPVTGTYSFRFLSSQYILSDQPIEEEIDVSRYTPYATIDFDGLGEYATSALGAGEYKSNVTYWEEGLGDVTLYNESGRCGTIYDVTKSINAPTTDLSKAVTYGDDDKYWSVSNSTSSGGAIGFVPLYDNTVMEIVWDTSDSTSRRIFVEQGDITGKSITYTDGEGLTVTKISTVGGNKISAGKEVKVYFQYENSSDKWDSSIYEIRLYADRTVVQSATPQPAPTATPAPLEHTLKFDDIKTEELNTGTDGYVTDYTFPENDLFTMTLYGDDDERGYNVETGTYNPMGENITYKSRVKLGYANSDNFLDTVATTGTHSDKTARCFSITPKKDNTTIEIVWGNGDTEHTSTISTYLGTSNKTWGTAKGNSTTATITDFEKGKPTYVYISGASAQNYIYEIKCMARDVINESENTESISLMSYTVDNEIRPSSVSQSYTWDFYNLSGTDGETQYTSNAILGNNSYVNGTEGKDCDSSYDWDIKVYATSDKPVNINNQSLYLYHSGEFDTDGTPQSGVLELIPEYSGTVEAVFEKGTIEIKQGDKTETQTSVNNAKTSVALNVTAGKSVYIYSTQASYLKAIKYTVDEVSGLARTVDQKWCNTTGSLVAAWDVTVANSDGSTTWYPINEFTSTKLSGEGDCKSADGKLTLVRGGNYGSGTKTFNNESITSLKLNQYKEKNSDISNYFSFTPDKDGTIEVTGYSGVNAYGTQVIHIAHGNVIDKGTSTKTNELEIVKAVVEKDEPVKIYVSTGLPQEINSNYTNEKGEEKSPSAYFHKIKFTPTDGEVKSVSGRVWSDILFLNAGGYQKSLYTKLNILTDEGFLYDLWWNGVQPYGFCFYSNNRGFLLDRWSLYSNPDLAGVTQSTEHLRPLEHSFYSYVLGNDVGTPPVRMEKDANGAPMIYNGNAMQSAINGNYNPVDSDKDAMHMIFFNEPDADAIKAYTGSATIWDASNNQDADDILTEMTYTGLGNALDNTGAVHYGTMGVGGEFSVTIDNKKLEKLTKLGSNTISVILDFSGYKLDENKAPVLNDNGEWEKSTEHSEAEKNNIVTISATVTKEGTYKITWDGRDAYGNAVPQGVYDDNVKSFVEAGTAHFPILDAEHNPNGFKVTLKNSMAAGGNGKANYIYYNNEAISPKNDATASSAWYFTGRTSVEQYPAQIGDGKNMLAGVDTSKTGAMVFGEYSTELEGDTLDKVYAGLNKGKAGGDGGYGNFAAIDMWAKYEFDYNQTIKLGVNPIVTLRPYVSFVATDGEVAGGSLPFKVSHIGYNMELLQEHSENIGSSTTDNKEKYGNTISTGFIATVTTNEKQTQDYVIWNISIPTFGEKTTDSGTVKTPTYIKVPDKDEDYLTTQTDADEAAFLAYEMYSGLFSDIEIDRDEEIFVGDDELPDWELDTSLDDDNSVPGMVSTASGAEGGDANVYEEGIMMIDEISTETQAGDYKRSNWKVKFNLNDNAVLKDADNVAVNKGAIYKVEQIDSNDDTVANVKIRYALPTTITGASTVKIGLVIDNLYAPGATASVYYRDNTLDNFSDITSILFDSSFSNLGTSYDTIQSTSFKDYATSKLNDYYTKNEGNVSLTVDYEMDFSGDGKSVTVGGTTISSSGNYSLFDGAVGFNNIKYDNTHGFSGSNNSSITVAVPGDVNITVGACNFDDFKIVVTDSSGNTVRTQEIIGESQGKNDNTNGTYKCNDKVEIPYAGNGTNLTIKFETSDNGKEINARFWIPYLRIQSTN